MSKECNIVADLLPLYQDGVCTEDSRELVETHLAGCESCRRLAEQISQELAAPAKAEEIDALKDIKKSVRRGWRKAFLKGAAAILAVTLLLFAGYCVWWYLSSYRYSQLFLEGKPAELTDDLFPGGNVYSWTDGKYSYRVVVPGLLRKDGGWESMARLDNETYEDADEYRHYAVKRIRRGENGTEFHVVASTDSEQV